MGNPMLRIEVVTAATLFGLLVGAAGGLGLFVGRLRRRPLPVVGRWMARVSFGLGLLLAACLGYAHWIEPGWLQVTHLEIATAALPRGTRLRIVQLTDLHLDGPSRIADELPSRVAALHPDLLVFTGDAANSEAGLLRFRRLLHALPARLGRYAVSGNHDLGWPAGALFGGGVATKLDGTPVPLPGGRVILCGAGWGQAKALARCLRQAPPGFHVVLYHSPDLVKKLAPLGVDLYLTGHTHGGQVRLPLYGAVVTFSSFGKSYEMGRYQVGRTVLYVNRGIGVEGKFPRLRFLCRPELAVIDLRGEGPATPPASPAPGPGWRP